MKQRPKAKRKPKIKLSELNMRNVLALLAAALLIWSLASCRTKIVEVEKVRSEFRDRVKVDSIYNTDTVYIKQTGDTVRVEVTKWRNRYSLLRDTICKTDSVPYPVEVIKIQRASFVQRWGGWVALFVVVLILSIINIKKPFFVKKI